MTSRIKLKKVLFFHRTTLLLNTYKCNRNNYYYYSHLETQFLRISVYAVFELESFKSIASFITKRRRRPVPLFSLIWSSNSAWCLPSRIGSFYLVRIAWFLISQRSLAIPGGDSEISRSNSYLYWYGKLDTYG